jgi:hypothetical protein
MLTRIIHTQFWEDSFISELDHKEKLTFLYLFTNSKIGLTGIYELPDKFILFDLCLNSEELQKMKKKFQQEDKIYFYKGYIAIKNAIKHSDYSKGNENQIKAFYRELEQLPDDIKKFLVDNGFRLVIDYLTTSPELVTQLHIKQKTKTINNKTKIKTQEENEIDLEKVRKELYKKMHWN